MLCSLHIENIAIMDNVEIDFESGFCVLTGETGAGKSILIDSINLLTGERSSKELVRTGCNKALVEGSVYTNSPAVYSILEQAGIDYTPDEAIILSREISKDGRNVVRINGRVSTTGILKGLCAHLINIHGQHDSQSILNSALHTAFLDSYANLKSALDAYKETYSMLQSVEKELTQLTEKDELAEQKKDMLLYQINEIEEADLKADEEETLRVLRKRFLNSEAILSALYSCHTSIYGDENTQGVCDMLDSTIDALQTLSRYDDTAKDACEKIQNLKYDLLDVTAFIDDMKDSAEAEEIDINEVESRLDFISRLKRKYGSSIPEILETAEGLRQELYNIENADHLIQKLNTRRAELQAILQKQAADITAERTTYAKKLEKAVMTELDDLDMGKTTFSVSLIPCDYTAVGKEKVEFLIATNKGESLKPLTKIASGGELSRIILALKAVLSKADPVETLIFDEVDTGVSGRAAQKIAEKIKKLSADKQIFVITHLSQVAAFGTSHYKIEKTEKNGKTYSAVTLLNPAGRIEELARIMSGTKITDTALNAAREMLEIAQEA